MYTIAKEAFSNIVVCEFVHYYYSVITFQFIIQNYYFNKMSLFFSYSSIVDQ